MINHLHSRHFYPERYQCWITDKLVVPLWTFGHTLGGVITYTPGAPKKHDNPYLKRYFPRCSPGTQPLWGLEVPIHGSVVFITESIFKAAALHDIGVNAWSLNSSSVSEPLEQNLQLLPYTFVAIGDDDKAGHKMLSWFRHGTTSRDPDELSSEERRALVEQFTYLGDIYERRRG